MRDAMKNTPRITLDNAADIIEEETMFRPSPRRLAAWMDNGSLGFRVVAGNVSTTARAVGDLLAVLAARDTPHAISDALRDEILASEDAGNYSSESPVSSASSC